MDRLVISGINLFEGGPLSIYYDCLDTIIKDGINKRFDITIFVHKKDLFAGYNDTVEIAELPDSRSSYAKRLWYEYVYFKEYSEKHPVSVWISLHDITPRVRAQKIYTYCHNPAPFMKKDISKLKYSAANVAFSFFYKYLYRINIKAATAIIVQQNWMRNEFLKMYPVKSVIVARPDANTDYKYSPVDDDRDHPVFLFASFPRYFKNFEVICKACKEISSENFEVWLTLDGSENKYSEDLKLDYGDISNIKWVGLQSRDSLFRMYDKVDCMIFPSLSETWGLPISEFKLTGKPMILADLPYAHETLGSYDKVLFFDPNDHNELAKLMRKFIHKDVRYDTAIEEEISEPYAKNWHELLDMIL